MGFFSSTPKYTEIWAWEGPGEGENREARAKNLASRYGIDRRNVLFFSLDHAMSESRRMYELRGPTPLPDYDDVKTKEAAWNVIGNGGAVVWHQKGDYDEDWPNHNFLKFTKV